MKRLHKLLVITEGGRVIGTQVVTAPPSPHAHATAVLRAGPGQQAHEIEFEVPEQFDGPEAIEGFHDLIAARLRLKK